MSYTVPAHCNNKRLAAVSWSKNTKGEKKTTPSTMNLLLASFPAFFHYYLPTSNGDFNMQARCASVIKPHTSLWIVRHLWFLCCLSVMITRQNWQPESTFMPPTVKVSVLCAFTCLFSHLQAKERAADVREPLVWSETWKEKAGGCVEYVFKDYILHVSLCVLLISKRIISENMPVWRAV